MKTLNVYKMSHCFSTVQLREKYGEDQQFQIFYEDLPKINFTPLFERYHGR